MLAGDWRGWLGCSTVVKYLNNPGTGVTTQLTIIIAISHTPPCLDYHRCQATEPCKAFKGCDGHHRPL